MEVFSVFATLSLTDMLSGPLGKIKGAMGSVDSATASLGTRMGNLAMAMAPVGLAAGLLLGMFGMAASKAMAFESAMSDVAKVVNFDTQTEFNAMSETVKEMAGRIPMAAEGIAAIIAAAGQSGVAKQDLTEFAEQAAKMGVAFDLTGDQAGKMMADWRAGMNLSLPKTYALADAVNYLSNNMNAAAPALGEVIQRVGAAAMSCGLAETQVAALGAAFLSAGASPEIAATALKKFTTTLVKGTAMSKEQAAAFQGLGFSATDMAKSMQTDAQGTIFKVLQALADKPKELQMSLLTQMFGEEAIGAIAPLLQNMGNLTQAFELTGDATKYAGSMQAEFDTKSKTTKNALILLTNKFNNLAISVGSIFLPAISWAAIGLGKLADAVRWVVDTPFGQWIVGLAGGVAAALVGVTTLAAALWFFSAAGPMIGKALAPINAALLGLGWPILLLIAAVGLLYVAYQNNFGGIADTLNRWWDTISLVARGVIAIFQNLTGSSFELRGALAQEIHAAGLEELVTNVARMVYRIKEFFAGIWENLKFDAAVSALTPAILIVCDLFSFLGNVVADVFGTKMTSASSEAQSFGQVVGTFLSWCLEGLATVLTNVVRGVDTLISCFRWMYSLLTGDWATAIEMAQHIWDNLCASFMAFADLFRIGDWIRNAWAEAQEYLAGINLYESGAKLLDTFIVGISSKASGLYESVRGALGPLGNLLPHSDAKEGPLSTLTLSGSRMMTTLGEGVDAGAGSLFNTVSGSLGTVGASVNDWWSGLFSQGQDPNLLNPDIPAPPAFAPETDAETATQGTSTTGRGGTNITVHIGNITLPDVKDAQGFLADLQDQIMEYGGATA